MRLGAGDGAVRSLRPSAPEELIHCLVLWNIDLTLVDVTRVTRDAYVDAFRRVMPSPA